MLGGAPERLMNFFRFTEGVEYYLWLERLWFGFNKFFIHIHNGFKFRNYIDSEAMFCIKWMLVHGDLRSFSLFSGIELDEYESKYLLGIINDINTVDSVRASPFAFSFRSVPRQADILLWIWATTFRKLFVHLCKQFLLPRFIHDRDIVHDDTVVKAISGLHSVSTAAG